MKILPERAKNDPPNIKKAYGYAVDKHIIVYFNGYVLYPEAWETKERIKNK